MAARNDNLGHNVRRQKEKLLLGNLRKAENADPDYNGLPAHGFRGWKPHIPIIRALAPLR